VEVDCTEEGPIIRRLQENLAVARQRLVHREIPDSLFNKGARLWHELLV